MSRSSFTLLTIVLLGTGAVLAADAKKDEAKLSKDEQRILDLTNEARAKDKLPPLKANATLMKVARAHAANMAKQRKMEHVLDGKNPAERVEKAGYDYQHVGENIAFGEKGFGLDGIFKGWMESKVHRDNILNGKFDEIGIGVATNGKGETYYAQDFGKLLPKE